MEIKDLLKEHKLLVEQINPDMRTGNRLTEIILTLARQVSQDQAELKKLKDNDNK